MISFIKNYFKRSLRPSLRASKYIEKEKLYASYKPDPIDVVITKTAGNYVWDIDKKRYLDCIAGDGALNLGHNYLKIKRTITSQLDELTLASVDVHNHKLGETCRYLTNWLGYDRVVLTNNEVEASRMAIEFAKRWASAKKDVSADRARIVIASENHLGWTDDLAETGMGAAKGDRRNLFYDSNIDTIPYNDIEALEEHLDSNADIAAFMIEPIQHEEGVVMPTPDYLRQVRALCIKYNVLMVLDEATTGLGRTGRLLCQEHEVVKADMVCIGKSLSGGFMPISAVLVSHSVFECNKTRSNGSTFDGNPLACAIVKTAVKATVEEKLCENAENMGNRILNKLLSSLRSVKAIKSIRGKGLMIGIEFQKNAIIDYSRIHYELLREGTLCRKIENNILKIMPPLLINGLEADYIHDTLSYVINKHT